MTCRAEVWQRGALSHRCTRSAGWRVRTKHGDRIDVCGQHARSAGRHGLWIIGSIDGRVPLVRGRDFITPGLVARVEKAA